MGQPRIAAGMPAAGKGTRLQSEAPTLLHEVCGRPMLAYVFDACREAGVRDCVAVIGHRKELVVDAFPDRDAITWVEQVPQLGTSHAVMVCREQFADYDHALMLCGDGPLTRSETTRIGPFVHLADGAVVADNTTIAPFAGGST